jgi:hypothetical protein
MDSALWTATRAEIKKLYDAMPDSHKSQAKEIAASKFPDLMAEIEAAKARFDLETEFQQQAYWSRRYIALHKTLFRNISLTILGVQVKAQHIHESSESLPD